MRHRFGLRFRTEVDQNIATGDKVQAREGWITEQVLHREHGLGSQAVANLVALLILREVPFQPRRRDIGGNRTRVPGFPRDFDRLRVDVGGEDLQAQIAPVGFDRFAQQDAEGPDFLAGTAAGHPDPERTVRTVGADQARQHIVFEEAEDFRVTEEAGDVDQQVGRERLAFLGAAREQVDIVIDVAGRGRGERHAPRDAPDQRAALVLGEVSSCVFHQQPGDHRQPLRRCRLAGCRTLRRAAGGTAVPFYQCGRNVCGQEHLVDIAGPNRTLRHAVGVGFGRILGQDETSCIFDGLQPLAAICAGSRKNDAHGAGFARLREAFEKEVDRMAFEPVGGLVADEQRIAGKRNVLTRSIDVHAIALKAHLVVDLAHFHVRARAEDRGHQAFMIGRQVLDEDKGHARFRRHGFEQLYEGLQPAGGRADTDDRNRCAVSFGAGFRDRVVRVHH